MPTSLFQYEMLPTTWFYMSSLLIAAVFFRFNRLFCFRNWDVLTLMLLGPGLVYLAMGSALLGYLWLHLVGAALFIRLAFDPFLRRRPLLAPNLNFAGLAFSCVAASAFMIPNLFLNRGDACESPRAWRLEQILTAAEDADPDVGDVSKQPGYLPFLRATQNASRYFAPSREAWLRAAAAESARKRESEDVEFFGFKIRVRHTSRPTKRPAANAMRWASGAADQYAYDPEEIERADALSQGGAYAPTSLNGVRPAEIVPSAPIAPSAGATRVEDGGARSPEIGASTPRASSRATSGAVASGAYSSESAAFRWQPLSRRGLARVLFTCALQLGIILTIVLIGRAHLGSLQTGFAAALLYLLLPYVNQFSARLDHLVPTLLILLAVLFYRRPFFSGIALGASGALAFYPFFLAPLWLGYYWKKGAGRFALGHSAATLTASALLLAFIEPSDSYAEALASLFGRHSLFLAEAQGLWEFVPRFYRVPIISLFGVFCVVASLLLTRKDVGALVAASAATMLAVQFWMGRQGGLYMSWYLPLALLTIFRPNLVDRTSTTTVVDARPQRAS